MSPLQMGKFVLYLRIRDEFDIGNRLDLNFG